VIKLESAHFEEVRGIRKLDIDFRKATFAISGPNGSGKSGVIDGASGQTRHHRLWRMPTRVIIASSFRRRENDPDDHIRGICLSDPHRRGAHPDGRRHGEHPVSAAPISRFPVPDMAALPDDIRQLIQATAEKTGFIPNVFAAYAWKPDQFRAFFQYYDALMRADSGLTRAEREMIVVAVSSVNACTY
jgi:hypothetical protein